MPHLSDHSDSVAATSKIKPLWKWSDMWPSMVTHTLNLCSVFNPSKVHTHSREHTHSEHTHKAVNTHLEQWAAIYAAVPGEHFSDSNHGTNGPSRRTALVAAELSWDSCCVLMRHWMKPLGQLHEANKSWCWVISMQEWEKIVTFGME